MRKVIIIGAGFTGLTTAYFLAKKGIKSEVYERNSEIGGIGEVVKIGQFFLEKTYHAYFNGDHHLIELINDLGLVDEISYGELKLGFINSKGVYPFSKPIDILLNPNLNFLSKIKMGLIALKMAKIENWQYLDSIYSKEWLEINGNKNLWNNLFAPLFKIKWGGYYKDISAAWIWGRIYPRAKSRKKNGKEEIFFLKNSSKVLYERMVNFLTKNGCIIHLNSELTKINITDKKIDEIIINKNITCRDFDSIISTIPPSYLLKYSDKIKVNKNFSNIEYMDNVCMIISTKNNFTDLGQIPVDYPNIHFGGVINWTQLTGTEMYNGQNIYFIFNYLSKNSEILKYSNKKIEEEYLKDLDKVFKEFDPDKVQFSKVFKIENATPVFKKDYLKDMPDIKIPSVDNLYLGGMFNIYPISDFNHCVRISKEIVKEVLKNE